MSTTSANAVDVLEVMSHAIHCVRPGVSEEHYRWHKRLTEARAAAAELMEKTEKLLALADWISENVPGAGWHLEQHQARIAVANAKAGEDGPDTYEWDEGIAP